MKRGAFLNVAQGETLSNKLGASGTCYAGWRVLRHAILWRRVQREPKEQYRAEIRFPLYGHQRDKADPLNFSVSTRTTRTTRNDFVTWRTDNACFKTCTGVWAWCRYTPVFEELLHAFDTRPPVKSEVE